MRDGFNPRQPRDRDGKWVDSPGGEIARIEADVVVTDDAADFAARKAEMSATEWARWEAGRNRRIPRRLSGEEGRRKRQELALLERHATEVRRETAERVAKARLRLTVEEERLKSYVGSGREFTKFRKTDGGILGAADVLQFAESYSANYGPGSEPFQRRERDIAELRRELGADDPLPAFTAESPLTGYGHRLVIADRSQTSATHLRTLEEEYPLAAHRLLRDHFAGTETGGIYVGDAPAPGLDSLGYLAGQRARGFDADRKARGDWTDDRQFQDVRGVYSPSERVAAAGSDGHDQYRDGTATHEASHALDDALRTQFGGSLASETPEFRQVFDTFANDNGSFYPYYDPRSHPTGAYSEAFAEGLAVWGRWRTRLDGDDLAVKVARGLGASRGDVDRGWKMAGARKLVAYYEALLERIEARDAG